jgi:hypothetical protein
MRRVNLPGQDRSGTRTLAHVPPPSLDRRYLPPRRWARPTAPRLARLACSEYRCVDRPAFACATDDVLEEIGGDVLPALAAAPGDMRRSEKLE